MEYRKAANIRARKLSDVIATEITSGKSIKESFKAGISEKFKAHVTGIKEKFDPLNMAKALTGGSSLGPALLGKALGRSQKDITYFAQNARLLKNIAGGNVGKVNSATAVKGQAQAQNTAMLQRIFNFMKKTHEKDMLRFEKLQNFKEEEQNEKQKRHDELIKAILKSSGVGVTSKKEAEENDPFGKIMGLIENIMQAFEWVRALSKIGPWLARLFMHPAFLAFGAAILAGMAISEFLNRLNKATPNTRALSAQEAAEVLKSGLPDDIKHYGGEENLRKIIDDLGSPEKIQAILDRNDEAEMKKLGGRSKLESSLKELKERGPVTQPVSIKVMQNMATEVPTRPEGAGARAINWDKKFAEYYDPSGMRKDLVAKEKQKQEEWLRQNSATTPSAQKLTPQQIESGVALPEKVGARPDESSLPQVGKVGAVQYQMEKNKLSQAQKQWDSQYGDKYDKEGNLKQTLKVENLVKNEEPRIQAMDSTKVSQAVTSMSKENQDLNIRQFLNPVNPLEKTVVNKQEPTKIIKKISQPDLFKLDKISVRNTEPTFRRMLVYSTRVV
jgi:hypothetical protein